MPPPLSPTAAGLTGQVKTAHIFKLLRLDETMDGTGQQGKKYVWQRLKMYGTTSSGGNASMKDGGNET